MVHVRGTRPSKALFNSDLANDVHIALGEDPKYQTADIKNKITSLLDRGHKVSVAGYSLGSSQAAIAIADKKIHSRLENDNFLLSPGVSAAHPDVKSIAHLGKTTFAYHALDPISNVLAQHATSRHIIDRSFKSPLDAHMI